MDSAKAGALEGFLHIHTVYSAAAAAWWKLLLG